MLSGLTRILKNPIKFLIFSYLLLLIFEGALRKWFLPGLSNPLLIIRDPLALLIYVFAFQKIPKSILNPYVLVISAISLIAFGVAMVFAHGNLFVAVFGARTLCLHFPMIFVIGYFFDKEDVVFVGRSLLLLSIPMTLLLILQFSSPQSAWVNRAPGGETGMGLTGALGKYRPPGTFSYITGVVQFYTLAAGFLMSSFFERKYFPMWLTGIITGAILIAIPISISRTLFLSAGIVLGCGIIGIQQAGGSLKILGRLLFIPVIGLLLASQFDVFDEGIEAFTARWENSTSQSQGGFSEAIVGRFLGELIRPLQWASALDLVGQGIGMGTQAGAKIQTGQRGFLVAEGEWERLVLEMGAALGIAAIIFRAFITFKIGKMSFLALKKKNLLPWLLFSTSALLVLNGQWGQPTTLGFTVLGAGLCIAAMRKPATQSSGGKPSHSESNRDTTSLENNGDADNEPEPPSENEFDTQTSSYAFVDAQSKPESLIESESSEVAEESEPIPSDATVNSLQTEPEASGSFIKLLAKQSQAKKSSNQDSKRPKSEKDEKPPVTSSKMGPKPPPPPPTGSSKKNKPLPSQRNPKKRESD